MLTIEIVGAVISLLYLWLEYKANIWLWIVGVITPVLYIYIFFVSKFYAGMGINIYYLFASIYGWYCWARIANSHQQGSPGASCFQIIRLPLSLGWKLFSIFAVLFAWVAWILLRFTDSPVPYGEGLTTALSIIAMWMLARKYAEQWLVWLVVNTISAGLYFRQGLYPTGILFVIYAVVSVFGFLKWKKMAGEKST
ncbi:MAG: nicotinamide riboside transporter PnuC [Tannerella sp.]|jgi:nicotinamide mononucleotide transporter|nr:nicotinamide riboside transporter PnuC [Tannerella sp.]